MAALLPERRLGPIGWSSEDAETMLQRMWERWNEEKDTLERYLGGGFDPSLMHSLKTRFGHWLLLLADTVLPRLKEANDEIKNRALELVTGLEDINICATYAFPSTLFLNAEEGDRVADRLWTGLTSAERDEVKEALGATVLWLTLLEVDDQIPAPPEHLVEEIVNRIVARKMPALDDALVNVLDVLRRSPHLLKIESLHTLCVVLRYLLEDTKLPASPDSRSSGESHSSLPLDERPRYRQHSAAMAAGVYKELERRNQQIPEVLEDWTRVGDEDPLPEVRRAWRASVALTGRRNDGEPDEPETREKM